MGAALFMFCSNNLRCVKIIMDYAMCCLKLLLADLVNTIWRLSLVLRGCVCGGASIEIYLVLTFVRILNAVDFDKMGEKGFCLNFSKQVIIKDIRSLLF